MRTPTPTAAGPCCRQVRTRRGQRTQRARRRSAQQSATSAWSGAARRQRSRWRRTIAAGASAAGVGASSGGLARTGAPALRRASSHGDARSTTLGCSSLSTTPRSSCPRYAPTPSPSVTLPCSITGRQRFHKVPADRHMLCHCAGLPGTACSAVGWYCST